MLKALRSLTVSLSLIGCLAGAAEAGEARIGNFGGTAQIGVKSWQALKFETVIRQKYDFSCGSAALATLLSHHYDRPVSEEEVFDRMWAVGDRENIRAKGFSLLDMKLYLQSVGLRSDGFKISLDKLRRIGVPGIALIVRKGYAHFVVLRGVAEDYVVLGDPSLGSLVLSRKEFEESWNGILFAIYNDAQIARAHFNLTRDLPVTRRAQFDGALNRNSLAAVTVLMPGPNEF